MTTLTTAQVQHIAMLARLQLSPEELEQMTGKLTSILTYVDILNEVNTDDVLPTAQVTGLTTVLRTDDITASQALPDELLATSALPIVDHQILAPHAHS